MNSKEKRLISLPQFFYKSPDFVCISSIIIAGLLLTFPVVFNGCLVAIDFPFHLSWSSYFTEQLFHGELYPRWLQNMNAGFGSPSFFFYPPIPYYFTALLSPLAHYNSSACNALGLSCAFALVASGLTAYIWLREIVHRNAAAIASIFYMALPGHLAINLYFSFAFAAYWAFVWMPLILYFTLKIIRGSKLNVIGLAISFALLISTHLPTFLVFFPVPVGYVLFVSDKQRKAALARLLISIAIAVGLSAIYWLPAMTTQESVSMKDMLGGRFYYANNFLFASSRYDPYDFKKFWRYLELTTAITGVLAFFAWKASNRYVDRNIKPESNYWLLIAIASIFMTLPLSQFVWDILPPLQKIQFPYRFNAVLELATSALVAMAIPQVRTGVFASKSVDGINTDKKIILTVYYILSVFFITTIQILPLQDKLAFPGSYNTVLILSLIAIILVGITFIEKRFSLPFRKFLLIGFLLTSTLFLGSIFYSKYYIVSRINGSEISKLLQVSIAPAEHRPTWVPKEVFNRENLTQLSEKLPLVQVNTESARWAVSEWLPRRIIVKVDAVSNTKLTIHQFYYPGWSAIFKGTSQSLPVSFSEDGLLQTLVPAGSHEIVFTLEPVTVEKIAQRISMASAILLLLLSLTRLIRRKFSLLRIFLNN
ncbi:hypothetical protein J5X98_06755 [Leptothermofonsia sichuanensis E412]|uniref:hypothetical protein n=1 Tax=Leptothermofonsia sichuanensis TaxID=2917832 RepID=UPI001CA640C8|nr:hypothetical protein [Leptothermofonsia sichuanensis]QZZ22094.1 hypothetical protein J5X98_06755 [Leptothermofonsia sichuanensis E412]